MRSNFHLITRVTFIIVIFTFSFTGWISGQPQGDAGRDALQEARKLMSTNKNAEALQVLQRYGATVVPGHIKEQERVVTTISAEFEKEKSKMIEEIAEKEKERDLLKSDNEDIATENLVLTTNTIVFFSVLLGIVVFILLGRFRVLAKSVERLNYSKTLISEMEKETSSLPGLEKQLVDFKKIFSDFNQQLNGANQLLVTAVADKNHLFHKQSKQLLNSTTSAFEMIENRMQPDVEEKTESDLNQLIEEAINQAYFSMVSQFPEFNCTVVKDLEKILPKLEVYPEDIRFVLFNLLENAFAAVWTKRSNSPKGYIPTVTISSRKLPRFVQIRVKDNGIGIPEKNNKRVFDPFYSERNSPKHPGLGLSESHRIITEKHKGELYIESDIASSTDFIIRFPTLVLM